MEFIQNVITNKVIGTYIILALLAVIIIMIILMINIMRKVKRMDKRYRKVLRGNKNQNLEEMITGYMNKIDDVEKVSIIQKENYDYILQNIERCIQKVAIVRYKAFDDVGSDLSFSIALLDGKNSGIILTGIYGRNESTTYAKPIDKGISRYDLSEEEMQVLQDAISTKGK